MLRHHTIKAGFRSLFFFATWPLLGTISIDYFSTYGYAIHKPRGTLGGIVILLKAFDN